MSALLHIGIVQQANTGNRTANIEKSVSEARKCKAKGADLIVFQELHTGLYFCQSEETKAFDQAETIPGPSTEYFGVLARELDCVLVLSLFEQRAPGLFHNTAVVIERDGTIAGRYRKMHIPDDPAYYERYPEAARLMALAGAELLIFPTAIGYESTDTKEEQARQQDAWVVSQRAHAVANGVISVNRTGFEPDPSGVTGGIQFWGSSFVVGPQGEFLWQAPQDKEISAVVTIDRARTAEVRRIWPFFRDRRIDAYGGRIERSTPACKPQKIPDHHMVIGDMKVKRQRFDC